MKDSFSILTGKGAVLFLSLLNGILLARILGPEGKGIVTAILIYPALLTSLLEMGIRQAVVYHVGREEYNRKAIIGTVFWFLVVSAIIGSGVTAVLMLPVYGSYPTLAVIMAIGLVPLRLVRSYTGGMLVGSQKMAAYSRILWLPPAMGLLGTVFFVWHLGWGVVGAVLSTFAGALLVAAYAFYVTAANVRISLRFSGEIGLSMLRIGFMYAIALFVINLNYKIDIIFLERLGSVTEVGFYSLGVRFAELIWQVPAAVGVVVFARSAGAEDSRQFSLKVLQLFRVVLILCTFVALVLAAVVGWVIPILYSQAFVPAISMLRLLLPGIVVMVVFKVLNFDMAGRGRPLLALRAALAGLFANVILNLWLIPRYGGNGAAIASTISYTVFAGSFFRVYLREVGVSARSALRFSRSDFAVLRRRKKVVETY